MRDSLSGRADGCYDAAAQPLQSGGILPENRMALQVSPVKKVGSVSAVTADLPSLELTVTCPQGESSSVKCWCIRMTQQWRRQLQEQESSECQCHLPHTDLDDQFSTGTSDVGLVANEGKARTGKYLKKQKNK